MKKVLFNCLILTCCIACNNNNTQNVVERISCNYELVSDSIYTVMPGKLMRTENHVVWEDPISGEYIMHVIDINTGKEVGLMGKKGQGPNEFLTPSISKSYDNTIYVFDLNTKKQAIFSVEDMLAGKEYYTPLPDLKMDKIDRIQLVEDNEIVFLAPETDKILGINVDGENYMFGKKPIDVKNIENGYDHFQGGICYNPKRKKLLYTTSYRYYALYEKNSEDKFVLSKEINDNIKYSISGNKLHIDKGTLSGAFDVALTSDYIVAVQRDYDDENSTQEVGARGVKANIPKTIFVYNYDLELLKIVKLEVPLIRIAGDIKDNTIYAITMNPEYMLIKFSLDL